MPPDPQIRQLRQITKKSGPFVCDTCHRTLSRGADLRRHAKTHLSKEKRAKVEHRCPEPGCTYKTLQPSNLKTHRNTHTGELPNKCPNCSRCFSDPGSLIRHRRSVHNYKPQERNYYVTGVARHVNAPIAADSPESGLDSTTSPSTSQRRSLSAPLSVSVDYATSPVEPAQELSVTLAPLAPSPSRSESRITLPGVSEILAGALHWQNDRRYSPYRRSSSHNGGGRHPAPSTSTAAFNRPSPPPLPDYQPSIYTYPPPLPPAGYSEVGPSRLTNPSRMETYLRL
ncbi:c2h2 finger domain [Moniliophthora roreri MCA 2997]|uniref:C2h2 finger domain n=1 Tax=Moniliophthora roreri (strain MCA 2997) TaxID=1381753 RepID=V2XF75_MONRO|nr:c2h2 finger domain [Moniliophthora roreri MCA 2997]KAI3603912.1 c2h2 finger domain [Moniliophthora roreri]